MIPAQETQSSVRHRFELVHPVEIRPRSEWDAQPDARTEPRDEHDDPSRGSEPARA
jgi:hypothetical protein